MFDMDRRWAAGLVSLFIMLAACSETDSGPTEEDQLTQCVTKWRGTIPNYSRPSLTIRACLTAERCSEEFELPLPNGVARHYPDFTVSARLYPDEGDNAGAFELELTYVPEVAAEISEDDRPTLIVKDDAGTILIDSAGQLPFETADVDDEQPACKTLSLNLDGSQRVE